MSLVVDHIIEGNLRDGANIDFEKEKLAVHAFVKGKEVAKADVDTLGRFTVTFASDEERPLTELRVTPAQTAEGAPVAASEQLEPAQYSLQENIAKAQKDFKISHEILEGLRIFRQQYRMHGTVFAETTLTIEPAPALKVDFYEFSWQFISLPPVFPVSLAGPFGPVVGPVIGPVGPKPIPHILPEESYLGTAFTDLNGGYDFRFFWRTFPFNIADPQPDIVVRISQFSEGIWKEVFRGPVDWDILPDFHRDFLVPAANLRPAAGPAPTTGFAFSNIGLIPVDSKHLIDGYAFTDAFDPQPIANMQHRPFGGTLRISGLFAKTPAIAKYTVQVAKIEASLAPVWTDVLDPLYNLRWNPTTRVWDHVYLGPDQATHRFTNIENEPNWFEPMLKFTFNSAAKDDGLYAFRITGFDGSGNQVGNPVELPALCIDNTVPLAGLVAPSAEKCGGVKLTQKLDANGNPALDVNGNPIHTLALQVTAYDPAGHVLNFGISASRGSQPFEGNVLAEISPSIFMATPGAGIYNQTETVTVKELPAAFADCPTLAYSVYLGVQGSSTNGYTSAMGSQYVSRVINLTITKP